MKRLRLLRHAKSGWDEPGLDDRARPLAPRGRKATRRLARWIAENDVRPGLVLCSPALRARETIDPLLDALGAPEVVIDERLYHASASGLLHCVRELADTLDEVLLVGHNPGLADLSLMLARPGALRDRVAAKLPTGAFATLEADGGRWGAIGPATADLVGLVLPRELA
jgi:phosphohistidine phosphatase